MPQYFFDTSALVKRYHKEDGNRPGKKPLRPDNGLRGSQLSSWLPLNVFMARSIAYVSGIDGSGDADVGGAFDDGAAVGEDRDVVVACSEA